MFVSKSMIKEVFTIEKSDAVIKAKDIMVKNRIRHLPVVDGQNRLIGIVTDRDIRSALPLSVIKDKGNETEMVAIGGLTVNDIMTPDPKTITPMHTIEDALLMIQHEKVGAFPVVDPEGFLMGILSVRDLLRAFVNVMGINEPGTLLCILVEEKLGQMKKIVDAVTEANISFGSILVARYWEEGKRAVFPYLLTNNVGPIKRKFKSMGFEVLSPMDWYIDQLPKK